MSKHEERRRMIRAYKEDTGIAELNMYEVAMWVVAKGWPLPEPRSPIEILARQFATSARQETEVDIVTGRQFRVYHAVPLSADQQNLFRWVNIHDASRPQMERALHARRQQMVGDAVQLTFDMLHWNRMNPEETPIEMGLDLRDEVKQRVAARRQSGLFDQPEPEPADAMAD